MVVRKVGKYEVGRTIGEGTFAKVKFAQNTETGESVAMKVLDRNTIIKHKMVDQIKREISIMKLVRHPYVVRLHEVLASRTKIYIILEYITGGELFDKIVRHGRLSEAESRRYFQQLIDGVDFCHSKGVYHRDLKPENLLLDSQENIKISDFGLSALPEQGVSLLRTTCGTPNYVAPEVLSHKGYDGAVADVWSCGVILYVLMAGYLPFDELDLTTLYSKIEKAEFSCPSWFPVGAKSLIHRILDPNPQTVSIVSLTKHLFSSVLYALLLVASDIQRSVVSSNSFEFFQVQKEIWPPPHLPDPVTPPPESASAGTDYQKLVHSIASATVGGSGGRPNPAGDQVCATSKDDGPSVCSPCTFEPNSTCGGRETSCTKAAVAGDSVAEADVRRGTDAGVPVARVADVGPVENSDPATREEPSTDGRWASDRSWASDAGLEDKPFSRQSPFCFLLQLIREQRDNEQCRNEDMSPLILNAFDLIILSQGLNLASLFDRDQDSTKHQTRFLSQKPAKVVLSSMEVVAQSMGFKTHIRNFKMRVEGLSAKHQSHFSVILEIFEVAPTFLMIDIQKAAGDAIEYLQFYKNFRSNLEDIIWKPPIDSSKSRITKAKGKKR
ncbi:hypothetical protein F2P56_025461 [Juglans regia]|uniref:non-specific serine/threonine protein kinase n=1 Tax=Juglans regia TaxID=51240 RepID=A0A833X9L2_JUGRE|nr:hypothetical protein F2P56_025461 [Juglans regia]